LLEIAVDGFEDVLRLLGHALAGRVARDNAGQIDGVAVDDDLAHARAGFVTYDAHWSRSLILNSSEGVIPRLR